MLVSKLDARLKVKAKVTKPVCYVLRLCGSAILRFELQHCNTATRCENGHLYLGCVMKPFL
jgi:hypothetical protein